LKRPAFEFRNGRLAIDHAAAVPASAYVPNETWALTIVVDQCALVLFEKAVNSASTSGISTSSMAPATLS
jgi:hypothetical protein